MGTEGRPASHFKYVGLAALQAWTQSRVIMSALFPKADMCGALAHVRFAPESISPCFHLEI